MQVNKQKCSGQDGGFNNACIGDDLGELMDCPGYCEKQVTLKTGGFFLTMNSGIEISSPQ